MERVPETELMEEEEQVCAYAKANFADAHDNFIKLLRDTFAQDNISGYVLDLGCGYGDIAIRFARTFEQCVVHGIDGSEAMINYGREMLASVHDVNNRVKLFLGKLPYESLPRKNYDIIICNSLLHHLHKPQILYQTILKYAAAGAPIFIMDLKRPETITEAYRLVETYVSNEPEILKRDFFNSLLAAYKVEEIVAQLKAVNMDHLVVKEVSDRHIVVTGYNE